MGLSTLAHSEFQGFLFLAPHSMCMFVISGTVNEGGGALDGVTLVFFEGVVRVGFWRGAYK